MNKKTILILLAIAFVVLVGKYFYFKNVSKDAVIDETTVIACTLEQRDVDACIEIYQPVCAKINVQCITTPCEPVYETIANSCKACQNSLAESYTIGECVRDES